MNPPFELTCEYGTNPLGIDATQPRLGWLLESNQRGDMQSAYQILVAGSEESLKADRGDKWDIGKVTSGNSVNVAYSGSALASGETCWWKVRVWDGDDHPSAYSQPAKFEMGLLDKGDWEGEWIGADTDISSPLLRKVFELDKPVKGARLHISGLGWYELYLNGQRVGDHILDPGTSDYSKRVLYVTYDVTDLMSAGANAVGVMLGNGWYCEPGWKHRYGDSPRLLMQMNVELADGSTKSIVSETGWKVSPGPITRNDLYGGETYDARLEQPGWTEAGFDDSDWEEAVSKEEPGGKMVSQTMPPIRVNKSLQPVNISEPEAGVYLYDLGQLFGGWVKLRLKGSRGAKVTIRYSNLILPDSGLIDQQSGEFYHRPEARLSAYETNDETDFYILKGDQEGEVYEPRFTYHPVRYVQIESDGGEFSVEDVQGQVVHSDVDLSGGFECSNPTLNRIHELVHWTVTNGLFGIPLDCLHREHWAWTDPATVASSIYPRKHMPRFWTKWLDDIKDAQYPDGRVPDICPNYVQRENVDPAWGSNYPILVWYLYQYFDDVRILESHYGAIKGWVDYLTSIAENHTVTEGHYGDHMLPGEAPGKEEFVSSETPPPLLWTGYYYLSAAVVSQVADRLGKADEAEEYAGLAEEIKDVLNEKWLNSHTHEYAGDPGDANSFQYRFGGKEVTGSQQAKGSQTANLFPLALGIVPEEDEAGVVDNIVKNIVDTWSGHLHTGNTGTACLIDTLTAHGRGDVLYNLVSTPTYPGWGYMVAQAATTIWESWSLESKVGAAESMIMWASIDEFFYNDLAGIVGPDYYGPGTMTPGFREIDIEPHVLGDLEHAGASIKTVRGIVSSRWKRAGESITLEVKIPVNSRASVSVPTLGLKNVSVGESDEVVWKDGAYVSGVAGIAAASANADYVTFDVGSGSYRFELRGTST